MNVNLPVWGYYTKDGSQFIDPLYAPYTRVPIELKDRAGNTEQICPVNPYKKQGYKDGLVHPELVRKGWGLSFQLLHPDKDQCPHGWTKGEDGWCVANQPEFEGTFYTKDAHVPMYQYHDGYAPREMCGRASRQISQFDRKSVNPFTGNYSMLYQGKPSGMRQKYGHLPAKDSYLA